jgi:hypothetical protein
MKWIAATAFITALMIAPARAEDAAGPSVGHPLSPLCDLICGGTWEPTTPPYPDEFRTTMTYAWDSQTQSIKGDSTRMGGIAGIRQVMTVTFAYDEKTNTITESRTPDPEQWSKIGGEIPESVTGIVTLADSGFQTRIDSKRTPGEMMVTAIRFETPDLWVERSEITATGQSTLGTEVRYQRTSE